MKMAIRLTHVAISPIDTIYYEGSAIVGHHDRVGLSEDRHMVSWNSSHGTAGCSQEALRKTGGDGLFYCFYAGSQ